MPECQKIKKGVLDSLATIRKKCGNERVNIAGTMLGGSFILSSSVLIYVCPQNLLRDLQGNWLNGPISMKFGRQEHHRL